MKSFSGQITGLRPEDLDLAATVTSGQMFRWARDTDGAWNGVTAGRRRARLSQSDTGDILYWQADGTDEMDAARAVRSLLRLGEVDYPTLAEEWCARDTYFAEAWARQPGVRILRQDPEECFFSFLCASVAPIARISGMLRAVAAEWGDVLAPLPGSREAPLPPYIAFPSASTLAEASESRLRELGLGFRAKRVAEAARRLHALPAGHLDRLREQATHEEARRELCAFFGVGTKIADCVCLFSLDKDGAIPVDTHIWRIACARYTPELAGKSLTPAAYDRVTAAFHDRFGTLAGWAQQTLFYRAAVARQG